MVPERVPFRYGLIYTPKRASFDQDHRKKKRLGFCLGLHKEEKLIYFSSISYRVAAVSSM